MSGYVDIVVNIDSDLIIQNVESIRKTLLSEISKNSSINLNLSVVKKIDISGLQLLISLSSEAKKIGCVITYVGDLFPSFLDDINKIAFAPIGIVNSDDLLTFVKETV